MNLQERELSRENKFVGKIISVDVTQVELPNGQKTEREIVTHPGAVCCLAINEQNECLLIKQWRSPLNRLSIEIPAGKLDATDESPLSAMKRELNEEAGYQAGYFEELNNFFSSPGFSDEMLTLFYCDTLTAAKTKLAADDDEFLEQMWVDLATAKQMVADGEIVDLKTLFALSYWETMQLRSATNG